ncbi:hypothetical protein F511_25184 [Dorcoceras hygrometricum]|uniref:Uncharacterized protein n=1 Tax=Dorcoceras hygrometricum TaxID=472368 RepID=A0A2Z7BJ67_9LAMI|nr:hypothetical protein F511_25184 [Dorcoceras hygrometricum]
MGSTKVVTYFVILLLLVGSEVHADCLNDCYAGCIGYESTICMLGCYYKCNWKKTKQVEELAANLTPAMKIKLLKFEEEEARKEAGSKTPRKLQTAMEF